MAVPPESPLLSTPMVLNSVCTLETLENFEKYWGPAPSPKFRGNWFGVWPRHWDFLRTTVLQDLTRCYISDLIPSYSPSYHSSSVTQASLLSPGHVKHSAASVHHPLFSFLVWLSFCFCISTAGKPWVPSGHSIPTLAVTGAPASTSCCPIRGGLSTPAEAAVTCLPVWSPIVQGSRSQQTTTPSH